MSSCPICKSHSEKLRFMAARGAEELFLHKCVSCQHEFLSPYPSDEWLAEEYSQYFHKRQSGLHRAKKAYFKSLFHKLDFNLNEASVLEFGPGEGDAVSAIMEMYRPSEFAVVERNHEATEMLQELGCRHYNMFLEEYLSKNPDGKKYDYILLFDVLEHLKDPLNSIEILKEEKLKPGGKIIATFPVSDSASRKLLGRLWPQYKVEHLNYFTEGSIKEISRKSKLKVSINDVLLKKLSLSYLLNVGKAFGPKGFRNSTELISSLVPETFRSVNLSLGFGERIVVFEN